MEMSPKKLKKFVISNLTIVNDFYQILFLNFDITKTS